MADINLLKALKQKIPFQTNKQQAEVGIIYLSNVLNSQFQLHLKQHSITVQQYNALRILRGQFPNPANINLIKDRMLDKMSDVSRIVDRLVKLELVVKSPNIIDKRNMDISITAKALDLLKVIDVSMANRPMQLNNLTEQELIQLNLLIEKIIGE